MTADEPELGRLMAPVGRLLAEASRLLKETWQAGAAVRHKGPADLVTDADLAVQRFLIPSLVGLLPGSSILAEEDGQVPADPTAPCWVIDPVDGTSNLVHGVRYVAISVALAVGGQPVLAWVQDVFGDHLYTARRGHGAWADGTPIHGSARTALTEAMVACGTPYEKERAEFVFAPLARVWLACHGLRMLGAAALELAEVAAGRLDAFFEASLSPWDFAAGWLLVSESGGVVTDLKGAPLKMASGSVLAANAGLHRELLTILADPAAPAGREAGHQG